jgi:hypothetical protein
MIEQPNKERCSEREPADSPKEKLNVIGGWLPSLTFYVRKADSCRLQATSARFVDVI